jgi:microcystin degradation protein MlrC
MKTILIAGLFHETHTFVDNTTSLADFQIRRGAKMLDCTGDASPLGGVLEFGAQHDWDFIPAIDYRATPAGTVTDAVLDEWWSEFETAWPPDCDALYLVLHGAMVCESFPDVEGEVLSRIRILPGAEHLPIFGVYDLHANFSPAMAQHADCLVAYRENPHTDARESAVRAASLLARHLETGERPHIELRQLPIILPPTGSGTADDPMKSLAARARELESGDLWALNIAAGFAFADTPDTGVSLQAITIGDASAALDALESVALELKELGVHIDPPVESVMPEIRKPADGLTVLVEPSDNIGGGAPGDGTGCLRALIDHQIENAAVCLNDPEAVRALGKVALGERITLALGGKGSRFDEGSLELEVELISLGDGRFELENKKSHLASMCGDFFDMGESAMVRHAGMTILLTSNKTAPFDLGQWRSQGIDPEQLNVIVVKAAVAHRAAYDPIAARSFTVDTPGPCSSDLKRLPYGKIQRPIYPLDD